MNRKRNFEGIIENVRVLLDYYEMLGHPTLKNKEMKEQWDKLLISIDRYRRTQQKHKVSH